MAINYFYRLKEYRLCNEEDSVIVSYGIEVLTSDAENACVVRTVPCISCDRGRVAATVDLCNRMQLSLIHLLDVIEDEIIHFPAPLSPDDDGLEHVA